MTSTFMARSGGLTGSSRVGEAEGGGAASEVDDVMRKVRCEKRDEKERRGIVVRYSVRDVPIYRSCATGVSSSLQPMRSPAINRLAQTVSGSTRQRAVAEIDAEPSCEEAGPWAQTCKEARRGACHSLTVEQASSTRAGPRAELLVKEGGAGAPTSHRASHAADSLVAGLTTSSDSPRVASALQRARSSAQAGCDHALECRLERVESRGSGSWRLLVVASLAPIRAAAQAKEVEGVTASGSSSARRPQLEDERGERGREWGRGGEERFQDPLPSMRRLLYCW